MLYDIDLTRLGTKLLSSRLLGPRSTESATAPRRGGQGSCLTPVGLYVNCVMSASSYLVDDFHHQPTIV